MLIEFLAEVECRLCLQVVAKATGYWVSRPSSQQCRWCSTCTADNTDLVYKVVLHTKMSRQKIKFAQCS